jgi:hypothetical protein
MPRIAKVSSKRYRLWKKMLSLSGGILHFPEKPVCEEL